MIEMPPVAAPADVGAKDGRKRSAAAGADRHRPARAAYAESSTGSGCLGYCKSPVAGVRQSDRLGHAAANCDISVADASGAD